jgi:hypothetical protein
VLRPQLEFAHPERVERRDLAAHEQDIRSDVRSLWECALLKPRLSRLASPARRCLEPPNCAIEPRIGFDLLACEVYPFGLCHGPARLTGAMDGARDYAVARGPRQNWGHGPDGAFGRGPHRL